MINNKKDFFNEMASQLKNRDNPTDLKPSIVGVVKNLNPLTVSIENGAVNLVYGQELMISEWFKIRCDIDKNTNLSSQIPDLLEQAKAVKEIHSQGGAACKMPQAIDFVCQAVSLIDNELLRYKCDLKIGDFVIIESLEQVDSYVLVDKILDEEKQ